jgi:Arc/MetJ family transcription regulator
MLMARRRVDLRLDEELLARVDARAEELGQTRTKFVERALEKALGETGSAGSAAAAGTSAPSRAPVDVPGVKPARELLRDGAAMERQARLNAARAKKK